MNESASSEEHPFLRTGTENFKNDLYQDFSLVQNLFFNCLYTWNICNLYAIYEMLWFALIFLITKLALCQKTPLSQTKIHNFKQFNNVLKAFKMFAQVSRYASAPSGINRVRIH